MEQFNENKLQNYFDKRDYRGAATYLSSLKAKSEEDQYEVMAKIGELERMANIQESLLEKMSPEERQAYHFNRALEGNGTIPHNTGNDDSNIYGDEYLRLLNGLKVDYSNPNGNIFGNDKYENVPENTPIKGIRLVIEDNEQYKLFCDKLGIENDDFSPYNFKYQVDSKTGYKTLNISLSNKYLKNALASINSIGNPGAGKETDYNYMYDFTPTFGGKELKIQGITTTNHYVDGHSFNYPNLIDAIRITERTKNIEQKFLDLNNNEKFQSDMVVTQYLGQGQANAYKLYRNGFIDIDEYNKITKERQDVYDRLLQQTSLHAFDVYVATDEDKNISLHKIDEADKIEIKKNILAGIQDKRLTYSAAINDGIYGTYITIADKLDSHNNVEKGDYAKGMTIFIPGLFKSDCEESFNNNTETIAIRDAADMDRWRYGKQLSDGNYIGSDNAIGRYKMIKNNEGDSYKKPISDEEFMTLLNQDIITKNIAKSIINKIDSNGLVKTLNKNGKLETVDINKIIENNCIRAIEELYPKDKYNDIDRLYQLGELRNNVLKLLNSLYIRSN